MGKYIIRAYQEKQTHDTKFKENVLSFINFLSMPCSISKACLHIIAELLLENVPYKTKHTCISLKDGEGGKLVLVYFLLYSDFAKKGLTDFSELSVQIIFDEVCLTASKIEGLIDNIYCCMPEIFNIFFTTKNDNFNDNPDHIPLIDNFNLLFLVKKLNNKFALLQEIVFRLKYDTTYLLKITCTKYIGTKEKIYTHMIDTLALLQNVNPIKAIYPHPIFKVDGYNNELLEVELSLLDIFSSLISVLDFGNKQMIKNIFQYFSKKINKKSYKQLEKDEYTFHIP